MPLLTMLLPILSNLFGGIIDKLFPDPVAAAQAKLALQVELDKAQATAEQYDAQQVDAQSAVVQQEMKGPNVWLANWRGLLELSIVVLIISHWFIVPLLNTVLNYIHMPLVLPPFPDEAWTVLEIGLGGYVGKQAINAHHDGKLALAQENNANAAPAVVPDNLNENKYFTTLKKAFPTGMTQSDIDIAKAAIQK